LHESRRIAQKDLGRQRGDVPDTGMRQEQRRSTPLRSSVLQPLVELIDVGI